MLKIKLVILGIIVSIALVAGCVSQPYATTSTTMATATTISPGEGELKELVVEGSEFEFNPSSIEVNEGDRIRLTFKNKGSAMHNLVIEELGISTDIIPSGSTDTVEFNADMAGTFSFYCSVPGHRSAGMEGSIIINEGE